MMKRNFGEEKFWQILYIYIPIALIGILFFGHITTPSYYTLIFLGVVPFFILLLNKKIGRGDLKKSFLYSLPLLWLPVADFIGMLYKFGSDVLSHLQWPWGDPSTLSSWEIFNSYIWHPFVIFSFSMNFFFLCVVQTAIQKHLKPKWAILTTTCIWTLFFLSIIWIDTGGLPGNIIIVMPVMASLFMICSFAFYKSNEIIGQVILLGIILLIYVL